MADPATPHFSELQDQVDGTYRVIKRTHAERAFFAGEYDRTLGIKFNPELPRSMFGKLLRRLHRLLNHLYFNIPEFKRRKKEALRILEIRQIREVMCSKLANTKEKTSPADLESRLVKIVTETLSDNEVAERFQIVADPQLLGLIVFELTQVDLDELCSDRSLRSEGPMGSVHLNPPPRQARKPPELPLLTDYTRALELDPFNDQLYRDRGSLNHAMARYADAIGDFTRVIEIDPGNAEDYYNRGLSYLETLEFDQAAIDFERAVELDPSEADFFYVRATAYANQGRFSSAIADLGKAIEIDPRQPDYYYVRGLVLAEQGKLIEAIADATKAIELNCRYAEGYTFRAELYRTCGETSLAEEDESTARKLAS